MNIVSIRQHYSSKWEVIITNEHWKYLKEYIYCDYVTRELAESNAKACAQFYNAKYKENECLSQ